MTRLWIFAIEEGVANVIYLLQYRILESACVLAEVTYLSSVPT